MAVKKNPLWFASMAPGVLAAIQMFAVLSGK
jgi:hypothetical protein